MAALVLNVLLALQLTPQEVLPRTAQVEERVTVERVVVTGRVIDRRANPIRELKAADFRLRVDGRDAPIEAVEWTPGWQDRRPPGPEAVQTAAVVETPGSQLFVMLFQWELAGQKDVGFIRMMRQAFELADATDPHDRIAVYGFGSSLHLLQDFTTDRSAVRRAIQSVRNPSYTGTGSSGVSVSEETARCRGSDSIEAALVCVGNALRPIPGPKSLLFFGWTASSYRSSWRTRYPAVIDAIERSHVSVFSLDVSDGDHRLSATLKQLSADTGGFYQETHWFPVLARERVRTALEGSYEIVFRDPSTAHGWHRLDIEVTAGSSTALFPRWYRN